MHEETEIPFDMAESHVHNLLVISCWISFGGFRKRWSDWSVLSNSKIQPLATYKGGIAGLDCY